MSDRRTEAITISPSLFFKKKRGDNQPDLFLSDRHSLDFHGVFGH